MENRIKNQYVDINQPFALRKFTSTFFDIVDRKMNDYEHMIILCIGTDRSTGDSYGPLIGQKLSNLFYNNVFVYGDLDNPVHAKNLEEKITKIYRIHKNPFVIAIDACLGSLDHVGYITVGEGSIKPGIGVNKDLPEIGDIAVTGIVNFSGFMEFMVLQNTRLSLVMKMADLTAQGIRLGLWKYSLNKNSKIPVMI